MKNLWTRLRNQNGHLALVLMLFLIFALGRFVSKSASLCVLYGALFPWSLCQAYKTHLEGRIVKDCTWKWVCAYVALFVLSAFVTMSVDYSWSLTMAIVFTASFFLLYVPSGLSGTEMRDHLFRVGCCMVCVYLPFALLALLSVFTGRTIRLPGFNGAIGIQSSGDVADRIRIFTNTNVVARCMSINVLFSIYAICVKKNKLLRAFFGVSILVHVFGLAHTQSRTGMIAFSAAIGLITFRGVCELLKNRRWRMIAGAAACLIAAVIALNGLNTIYETDVRIARSLRSAKTAPATETAAVTEAPVQETEFTARAEARGQFDVYSSGRGDIWPPTVKYLLANPENLILGMGRDSAMQEIGKVYPQVLQYAHLHNSFLACATYCGIPFLICVLGFLCTLVSPAWKMFMQPASEENRGMFIIPVFIAMMLLMAIPEEMLFIKECYSNLLFYLMCGYVLRFKHLEKRTANEN